MSTSRPSFLRSLSSQSFKSTHDKPRLYVALYPRGGALFYNITHCDSYHWCLLVAPQTARKSDAGTRYHVQHTRGGSVDGYGDGAGGGKYLYEEQDFSESTAQNILVRVTVAKVTDIEKLEGLLRERSRDARMMEQDGGMNCLTWIKEKYREIVRDGKSVKGFVYEDDWKDIEECCRKYVKRKREMGRWRLDGPWGQDNVPTWNFWENRETTP